MSLPPGMAAGGHHQFWRISSCFTDFEPQVYPPHSPWDPVVADAALKSFPDSRIVRKKSGI